MIKEYAEAHPDDKVIKGIGWNVENMGGVYPTAKDLDKAVPDRPAFILDYTIHDGWLNTAALKAGNITKDTPDLLPGTTYWRRDEEGNPTGVAMEIQWMGAYVDAGAWEPEKMMRESTEKLFRIAAANGTTALLNPGVVTPNIKDTHGGMETDFRAAMKMLSDLDKEGKLLLRVQALPMFKSATADPAKFVAFAAEMKEKYTSDRLSVRSIKIHPEGNAVAKAAPFLEPYEGTDHKGSFNVAPEVIKGLTLLANKAGLDAMIHTDGDASNRAVIDVIVPDRPVMLQDYTVHDMWLNSKAMEMGGVSKDTKDPVPGLIIWVRDEEGNPTGYAKEFAWMEAFIAADAWQAEKMIADSQKKLYDMAASYGYTGYINQGLVTPNIKNLDKHYEDQKIALKLLDDLHEESKLKLRTFLQVLYKTDSSSVDDLIKNEKALKSEYDSDVIRISGIKVHPEGVHTSHASVMLEPWADQPDKVAKRGVSAERTDEVVMAANKAGFDASVHVDGSKTIRDTIDSYLKAKKADYTDARNTRQHFAIVHPDDMQHGIEHKIPVNITPIWATTWGGGLDGTPTVIGEERTLNYFQQIRTAIDGGTHVSIAADAPSTNPENMGALTQCEAAITRKDPSNPDDTRVFPPMSQALTLEQCLYATTMGGAYEARMEDKVGSIEVGKYADLVILEKNLFDVAPDDIADVKVEATMMDGNFTYRAGEKTSRNDDVSASVLLASAEAIRHFMCGHSIPEQHDHAHYTN